MGQEESILQAGTHEFWDTQPVPRNNVSDVRFITQPQNPNDITEDPIRVTQFSSPVDSFHSCHLDMTGKHWIS